MADIGELQHYDTAFMVCSVVFLSLATATLCMRLYVRSVMIKATGLDDWFLLSTWLLYVPLSIVELVLGIRLNRDGDPSQDLSRILPLTVAGRMLYLFAQIALKLALATFFLRIVVRPWHRRVIIGGVTVFTLFTFSYAFTYLFSCGSRPHWETLIDRVDCPVSDEALLPLNYIAAILNCGTDWLMAVSPIIVLTTLKLPSREKRPVYLLTMLGLVGSIVSVIRIPVVRIVSDVHNSNYTQGLAMFLICSQVEVGIGMIALSLAALRPLMRIALAKLHGTDFGSSLTGYSKSGNGTARPTGTTVIEIIQVDKQSDYTVTSSPRDHFKHSEDIGLVNV